MLPSNKFLLYEHSLRIPMLFMGPGIKPGSSIDFLGTREWRHNHAPPLCDGPCMFLWLSDHLTCGRPLVIAQEVDLAPTILSMAGITPPAIMDGMSVLPLLVPTSALPEELPAHTHAFLQGAAAARLRQQLPNRVASFHQPSPS
jgi:hypothetical protein